MDKQKGLPVRPKKQEPKLMNFSRMRDILEPHRANVREQIFMNHQLAVLRGNVRVFGLISQQKPPFTIDDHRLGIVIRGELRANINLVEKHICAGTLIFVGPGSILNPVSFSTDLEIHGIGLSSEFPMPFAPGLMPSAFNGQVRDFQLAVNKADIATARRIVDSIWHIVHRPDYNRRVVSSLVAAQMHLYDGLYRQHADRLQRQLTRGQTIFDRFIYLVHRHCQEAHHISFYAEKMCLTERYLGTVVRQTSGATAKEWIDRALIARAQVLLRHSDKSVLEISEELCFPNPAFFSKYFKRLTGQTPLDYGHET